MKRTFASLKSGKADGSLCLEVKYKQMWRPCLGHGGRPKTKSCPLQWRLCFQVIVQILKVLSSLTAASGGGFWSERFFFYSLEKLSILRFLIFSYFFCSFFFFCLRRSRRCSEAELLAFGCNLEMIMSQQLLLCLFRPKGKYLIMFTWHSPVITSTVLWEVLVKIWPDITEQAQTCREHIWW